MGSAVCATAARAERPRSSEAEASPGGGMLQGEAMVGAGTVTRRRKPVCGLVWREGPQGSGNRAGRDRLLRHDYHLVRILLQGPMIKAPENVGNAEPVGFQ